LEDSVVGSRELRLIMRLPGDLAEELEQLAMETGRSESSIVRHAVIESLEDQADYRHAVAVLESGKDQPNLTLEEAKRELGLVE
jgi:predicted DNA-binding protein